MKVTVNLLRAICLAILAITLASCSQSAGEPPEATRDQTEPSATRQPAATASPPTAALTPSPTIPILAPLPAGSPQAIVRQLLEGNLGCRLPCWWGMIPGDLTWDMAKEHLSPILVRSRSIDSSTYPGESYQEATYPLPADSTGGKIDFVTQDSIIVRISVRPAQGNGYDAARIVRDYGPPSAAYLWTFSEPREGSLPFALVLFYPKYSFLAQFYTEALLSNGKVTGCISDQEAALVMWSPRENWSFHELEANRVTGFDAGQIDEYKLLRDVADLDEFALASSFLAEHSTCISTEAAIWPPPT